MNPSDDLLAALRQWAADDRVDSAAKRRAELRWQRQLAGEELDLAGTIDHLGSSAAEAVFSTTAGNSHRGVVDLVGRDFLALSTRDGTVFLAHRCVTAIELDMSWRNLAASSFDESPDRPLMANVLSRAAEDRPHIRVTAGVPLAVRSGELVTVGDDVLVVSQIEFGRRTLVIPLGHVNEVTFV